MVKFVEVTFYCRHDIVINKKCDVSKSEKTLEDIISDYQLDITERIAANKNEPFMLHMVQSKGVGTAEQYIWLGIPDKKDIIAWKIEGSG
mgnify:CR=1 FL=1|jgi:hypothetical protein